MGYYAKTFQLSIRIEPTDLTQPILPRSEKTQHNPTTNPLLNYRYLVVQFFTGTTGNVLYPSCH